jgi:trk system potassium uptake protein TrkA
MSERANHVVIVGCGRVGAGLSRRLVAAGNTVAIIDKRKEAFRRLPPDLDVQQLAGIGFDRGLLREAGIERAMSLAAVTNGDNSNIVIARVARERFEVPNVVARIYDPRRAAIYERLGIPTVATVERTIEHVLRRVAPAAGDVAWIDPSARIVLVERDVSAPFIGHPLRDLETSGVARIVSVRRLGVALLPSPDLIAQEGDVVHLAIASDHLDEVERRLAGAEQRKGH